ncbi:type II toxin-antitoxin system RatA family toxin [Stenotrophobium rhamnosiphilum]|uniref:Ubiquinone-binding protein n=1 Tax=Stenotrophobium rhamnosiphilum TaxID=2029166 RepID=A0A2T5MHN0_9GAMM|nr:type II toxin-antitoxin system RatA family toxin [Stenotrophobium rhamnosiphilum]PTU32096.1 ubiquinone-binding protein [Stenotrophobium rhamnosiphilum]
MAKLERSALLTFSADELYRLVADIESYPQFLPGCVSARVESADETLVRARVGFRVKGLSDSFATENRMEHGTRIHMKLLDGPFKQLSGVWEFQPLAERACKVTLKISLEFGSRIMEGTLAPLINSAIGSVMDAFKQRAEVVYGKS